jgi:hypothetical protein
MHRNAFEVLGPWTVAANRISPSVRVIYDQGRVSDVSAPVEFVTSTVFTVSVVFLIMLAL